MGRHNKLQDEGGGAAPEAVPSSEPVAAKAPESGAAKAPEPASTSWKRKVVFVAPLPVLLLTIVVGIVAYSASTGQISLNFAGGAHEPTEPKDNQVSQRGPGAQARASRNASRNHHLYVAFRAVRTPTGFRGTATIVNRGAKAVPSWTFAFSIPRVTVVSATAPGAVVKQYRPYLWMRSAPGAAPLAPGQSVKITYVARGPLHGPTVCKLNYRACDRF
jgi:hypothetical protein